MSSSFILRPRYLSPVSPLLQQFQKSSTAPTMQSHQSTFAFLPRQNNRLSECLPPYLFFRFSIAKNSIGLHFPIPHSALRIRPEMPFWAGALVAILPPAFSAAILWRGGKSRAGLLFKHFLGGSCHFLALTAHRLWPRNRAEGPPKRCCRGRARGRRNRHMGADCVFGGGFRV